MPLCKLHGMGSGWSWEHRPDRATDIDPSPRARCGAAIGDDLRRGRYTVTGNGPYKLVLSDDVQLLTTDGSCAPADNCEIRIENAEVRLHNPKRGVDTKWRRVKPAS